MGRVVSIRNTPMPFISRLSAGSCSSVGDVDAMPNGLDLAGMVAWCASAGTGGPDRAGCSLSHTTLASNWRATSRHVLGGGDHVAAADVDLVFERERDRHGRGGLSRSPSKVSMLLTRDRRPEGSSENSVAGSNRCRRRSVRHSRGNSDRAGSRAAPGIGTLSTRMR